MVSKIEGIFGVVAMFFGFILLGLSANTFLFFTSPPTYEAIKYNSSTMIGPGSAVCTYNKAYASRNLPTPLPPCTPAAVDSAFNDSVRKFQGLGSTSALFMQFFAVSAGVMFALFGVAALLSFFDKGGNVAIPLSWVALFFNLMAAGWAAVTADQTRGGPNPLNTDPEYIANANFPGDCQLTVRDDPNSISCTAGSQVSATIAFCFINMFINIFIVLVVSCRQSASDTKSHQQAA